MKDTDQYIYTHWNSYYASSLAPDFPSDFAVWVAKEQLNLSDRVFELGCGNGRDSRYFASLGHSVLAIDACDVVIQQNRSRLTSSSYTRAPKFETLDLSDLASAEVHQIDISQFDVIYSRFVLHAVPALVEDKVLRYLSAHVRAGTRMIHEFRTTNDPLINKGTFLGEQERVTDHYRRFIETGRFRTKLKKLGWTEEFFIESDGLAPYKDEDPIVARVVYRKDQ